MHCQCATCCDFRQMESRPGGGGAGAAVWLLAVLGVTAAGGLIWTLAEWLLVFRHVVPR